MPLLLPTFFIYTFGLFNLLGISQTYSRNQLVFGIVGILAYFLFKRIGIHYIRINIKVIYWFFIALLILTYIIGAEIKGSKRWIDFHFFSFQSSEFLKVFFIIFLADFFTVFKKNIREVSLFMRSIFYFLLPTFIIFKQPDLGNAIVFTMIFLSIAFFSGIPRKNFMKIGLFFFLMIPLSWFVLKDYQKARLVSFLNPHTDVAGTSYNMIQAIVTVGSGKFLGKGLGLGTQSELYFLPENHTDFAYSALVEQFGFVGGAVLIALYLIIAWICVQKLFAYYFQRNEDSRFKFLCTIGFFSYFITQVFVNVGMNLGIMPITGITLPLVSYGGSSLITWMIAIALLI